MKIEIHVTADTLEDLWSLLSALLAPGLVKVGATTVPVGVKTAVNGTGAGAPESPPEEADDGKRGRGRPPGAKNKPKASTATVEASDTDPEPEAVQETETS